MAEVKNYPSNSIKSRENAAKKKEKPEITAVVEEGDARVAEPTIFRKIFNAFFPDATNKPLGQFFLYDMIIPTTKMLVGGMLMTSGRNISSGNNGNEIFGGSKKSYENYYNGKNAVSYIGSGGGQKRSKMYDCEHVWYSSLAKAQKVIDSMNAVLEQYPVVSVADMKEFSRLSDEIMPGDHHKGWTDIQDVKWYSDHGGYTVVFPPAVEL